MAIHVELKPDSTLQTLPPVPDKAEKLVPSISHGGIASLHVDSLNEPLVALPGALPLNLGNGSVEFSDLKQFVKKTLKELHRVPIKYSFGRDRHSEVTPFMFNQVKIDKGKTGMNGSWISFPDHDPLVSKLHAPGKYIAISAPVQKFFHPFMRMLQQESVPLIISLTAFIEEGRSKADPYLPYNEGEVWTSEGETYEVACTKVHSPIDLSDTWKLERRDFKLTLRDSPEPHYFSQWHLPNWKDHSPGAIDAVANLVKFAYAYRKEQAILAPIAVHCSGGIGRAGTFINCSECYERWRDQKPVQIFDIAVQSRLQRNGLGGNKDQYLMVYAVFEKLTS